MCLFRQEVFFTYHSDQTIPAMNALDQAGIPYRRRAVNMLHSSFDTSRARMGSLGIDETYRYAYQITVSKKNAPLAEHVLRDIPR